MPKFDTKTRVLEVIGDRRGLKYKVNSTFLAVPVGTIVVVTSWLKTNQGYKVLALDEDEVEFVLDIRHIDKWGHDEEEPKEVLRDCGTSRTEVEG